MGMQEDEAANYFENKNENKKEDIETVLVPISEIHEKIVDGEITHGLVLNALHFMEKMT